MRHRVKLNYGFSKDIIEGVIRLQIHKDQGFKVGDILLLEEIDGYDDATGLEIEVEVTHILPGGKQGVKPGYVAMSIQFISYVIQPMI